MRRARHNQESGFALLFVFLMAAFIAISLYIELPRVAFEGRRRVEQDLIDRGEQYRRAIQLFVRQHKRYPPNLEALENTNNVRFLRKRYKDPMTGQEEWRIIHVGPTGVLTDSLVHSPEEGKQENLNTFITEGPAIGSTITSGTEGAASGIAALGARRESEGGPADPSAMQGEAQPGFGSQPGVEQFGQEQQPGTGMQPGQATDPSGAAAPFGSPGFPQQQTPQPGQATDPSGAAAPFGSIGSPGFPQQQTPQPGQAYPVPGQVYPQPGTGQPQPAPQYPIGGQPFPVPGLGSQQPGAGQQSPTPGQAFPQPGTGQTPPAGQPYGFPAPPGSRAQPPTPFAPQPVPGVPSGYTQPFGQQPAQRAPGGSGPSFPQPGYVGAQGPGPSPAPQPGSGPPAPGAPNPALDLIRRLLTTPNPRAASVLQQQQRSQPAPQIGPGIAGVASKYEADSIKVYNERSKYNEWEFIYDLGRDPQNARFGLQGAGAAGRQQGQPQPGVPGTQADPAAGPQPGPSGPQLGIPVRPQPVPPRGPGRLQ